MRFILICSIVSVILFQGISCKTDATDSKKTSADSAKVVTTSNTCDHLTMAILWYQRAAETRALYYQGYNYARLALDKKLKATKTKKKNAVVVDIDETLLDNSPFEAKCVITGQAYSPESWKQWSDLAQATALPGAVEFLNYAKSKGAEVFYISNRKGNEIEASLKNLTALNFPFADTLHTLFRTETGSKEARRQLVAKDYNILLLIGDNLADFDVVFENRGGDYGFGVVDSTKDKFGDSFIVLPNPMYGDWEKQITDFKSSDSVKYAIRREKLVTY